MWAPNDKGIMWEAHCFQEVKLGAEGSWIKHLALRTGWGEILTACELLFPCVSSQCSQCWETEKRREEGDGGGKTDAHKGFAVGGSSLFNSIPTPVFSRKEMSWAWGATSTEAVYMQQPFPIWTLTFFQYIIIVILVLLLQKIFLPRFLLL